MNRAPIPDDPILSRITTLVVDDYPIWRHGLVHLLQVTPDIDVLAEVGTGHAALELARELRPDVILLDVNLPDLNGIQVATRLMNEQNTACIIILTGHDDDVQVFHAMQAGCMAYCAKDIDPDVLTTMIRRVMHGDYFIRDKVYDAAGVEAWLQTRVEVETTVYVVKEHQQLDALSPREMEVLERIAEGQSNRQIAQDLAISYQTVKNHVSSILAKMGVQDRMQAVLYAIRRGWVRLPDDR
jgi:DNA-binding NarL/FixJ family response regulator